MFEYHKSNTVQSFDFLFIKIVFSFVLEHLSSDNSKEMYKKLVIKSLIQVIKMRLKKNDFIINDIF